MTLLFVDSCNSYSDDPAARCKWDYLSYSYDSYGSVSDLREGSYNIYMDTTGHYIQKKISEENTVVVGMAYKTTAISSAYRPIKFLLGSDEQITFTFEPNGTINARFGDESGTILASSSSGIYRPNCWQYCEFKVVIHNSAGSVECKINGVSVLSASGIGTQQVSGGVDTINIIGKGYFTDFYIDNSSFHAPAGKGMRVDMLTPDATGTYSQMTPSTGATNYLCVDDGRTSSETDSDYVYSDTVNEIDTYNFTSIDAIGTDIDAVAVTVVARQDDVGDIAYRPVVRIDSAVYLGSEIVTTTSYLHKQGFWEANPDDSSAWEEADINSAEFGLKRTI